MTEDDKKLDAPPEKIKRTWEKWSVFDKTIFFEALNEFGKNFELLQNYIAKKKSKNGSDQVRNRDQIRFFYYRTLNKISKYVHFPADVKRYIQEIYLLVNYGELRKRITKLNERSGQRLNELVYRGSATVRLRGKTYRIRTPICRALKKINKIQDPVEEPFVRLPARAQLELTPANNAAWYRVQSLSHNPRLRAALPLQHRLGTLLQALEKRWQSHDERALEAVLPDERLPQTAGRLVVRAAADYKLSAQVIRPAPPAPVLNLCFQRYLERMRLSAHPPLPPAPPAAAAAADPAVRLSFENVLEELHAGDEAGAAGPEGGEPAVAATATTAKATTTATAATATAIAAAADGDEAEPPPPPEQQERERRQQEQEQERLRGEMKEAARRREEEERREEQDRAQLEQERRQAECVQRGELDRGWTIETAGTRTIGELYMMVNRPEKITLQYLWVPGQPSGQEIVAAAHSVSSSPSVPHQSTLTCPEPAGAADEAKWHAKLAEGKSLLDDLGDRLGSDGRQVKMLTSLLSQLLSVARLAKVKTERSCRGPMATVATQTIPTLPPPIGGREPLYYVSANARASTDLRRHVRIAPAYKSAPPATSEASGAMRPPLETALRALPRYSNRRGRPLGRKSQVVVQRMLPLIPRTQPNQISMVNLRLVSGDSQTAGSFLPVSSAPVTSAGITISMPMVDVPTPAVPGTALGISSGRQPAPDGGSVNLAGATASDTQQRLAQLVQGLKKEEEEAAAPVLHIPEQSCSESGPEPPPADDYSLHGAPSDVLMDVTLANSNSSFTGFLASFGRGGAEPASLQTPSRPLYENSLAQTSPPASPRVWSEIGDFSLSSILGHLEASKPTSKEALLDIPTEGDEALVAVPAESRHALPTSFQFTGLMPGDPLSSGHSPPT